MKKTFLLLASGVLFLTLSCEKDEPTNPVNGGGEDPEHCAFCLGDALQVNDSMRIESTSYGSQVPFFNGSSYESLHDVRKTPNGFYGWQGGVAIQYDGSLIDMVCVPNTLTFVHGRLSNTSSRKLNVQLPGTPLIHTIPDSLSYYLSPYGYTVNNYETTGEVFLDSVISHPGFLDSVVIHRNNNGIGAATIGAWLFESELRSICISNE